MPHIAQHERTAYVMHLDAIDMALPYVAQITHTQSSARETEIHAEQLPKAQGIDRTYKAHVMISITLIYLIIALSEIG